MEVERCESPDALRADRVDWADWGRWRGMMFTACGAAWGVRGAAPRFGRLVSLPASASVLRQLLDAARRWPLPALQRAEGQRLSRRASPRLDFGAVWGGLEVSL